jgi:homocysteine S-methyltransferase
MSAFLRALARGPLVAGGALGTRLLAGGVPIGAELATVHLARPRLLMRIHAADVAAGARVLKTHTFMANRDRFRAWGLPDHLLEASILAATALARGAGGFVVGCLGPAGSAAALADAAERLASAGCDAILLETFTRSAQLLDVVGRVRRVRIPVLASLARPVGSEIPRRLRDLGADGVGLNCLRPDECGRVFRSWGADGGLRTAMPSAGLPGRTLKPDAWADLAGSLPGALLIGGCCGTTARHIAALSRRLSIRDSRKSIAPPAPSA